MIMEIEKKKKGLRSLSLIIFLMYLSCSRCVQDNKEYFFIFTYPQNLDIQSSDILYKCHVRILTKKGKNVGEVNQKKVIVRIIQMKSEKVLLQDTVYIEAGVVLAKAQWEKVDSIEICLGHSTSMGVDAFFENNDGLIRVLRYGIEVK